MYILGRMPSGQRPYLEPEAIVWLSCIIKKGKGTKKKWYWLLSLLSYVLFCSLYALVSGSSREISAFKKKEKNQTISLSKFL